MDQRHAIRYDSELLPKKLATTTILLGEDRSLESQVVNYCALGMKVIIPPAVIPDDPPKKNDTVRVLLPVTGGAQLWFTGMCVHAEKEQDGSVAMGIYFYNPTEQNHLHALLFTSLNELFQAPAFIRHEWEELVGKLCDFDDPEMKEIGHREMDIIRTHRQGNRFRPGCAAGTDCVCTSR
ncbi:PilZ domain-containing protein [Geobacter sp. AOG2]|uniref:PilZ domain-containing protein n=1 Tax=Geobacter sp. AOG2 TaxID=1566347 RepID=UPI001CC3A13B|nr:PilZ domain-containing protein [Geobacter sp. AOG2]GFE62843.1 hypothetical protein AOG2_34320 [Geobacter sp. AOG2]